MKFEIRDNSQKGYFEGLEKVSATDAALTSAGVVGLGTDDDGTLDNLSVDDVGQAAAENASMQPMHHWWPR
jgi:hypothetical protein